MSNTKSLFNCKQCGTNGTGNFCSHCGQSYTTKRLTISNIFHEIFHFFSHLDKGFLFTLKNLLVHPGETQREYIDGHRAKYQKPFSMFFLCATIASILIYWMNLALIKHFDAGDMAEASFLHQYMVILQIVMLPIYALITYTIFNKTKYNYAETFVMLMYSLSILFLISVLIQVLKFIWPEMFTQFIELPVVLIYNLLTNLKFYRENSKWAIILKTIISSALCFLLVGFVQYFLIKLFS